MKMSSVCMLVNGMIVVSVLRGCLVLYCEVLYCEVLCCEVLYCEVKCCIVKCCVVKCCGDRDSPHRRWQPRSHN